MHDLPADYELVIRSTRGWFHLDLAEVWRYRDLLLLLVHRDFVAKYKQTILGPAWFILQPLLMTIVFTAVFARVAKIPTDGIPPTLFYLAGLLGWSYFAQTFHSTAGALIANAGLFRKVYFPRLVVPLSAVISNLLAFFLQLALFLCFWTYFKCFTSVGDAIRMSQALVWFPVLLAQIAALGLGVGLWLSALTTKYRDFTHLSGFLIQIWLYITPIIYPLSRIPERWQWLAALNPMVMPVEALKYMFLGQGLITQACLLGSIGMTALLLGSGVLVFNKVEKTFVDTV